MLISKLSGYWHGPVHYGSPPWIWKGLGALKDVTMWPLHDHGLQRVWSEVSESSFGVPCRTRDSTSRNWWWFCGSWASKSRPSKSLQSLDLKFECDLEASNWNPTETTILSRPLDPFSPHENLILPLFSLVVWFGFRCSASDTRDCGDILVRHLVKASLSHTHTHTRRDIEPVAAWCWWCRKISWAMSLGLWRTSRHPCMIHESFPTQWRLVQGVRSKRLRELLHVLLLLACQHFSKRCGSWWCFWWRGFMRGPLQVNSNLKIFCFRNSMFSGMTKEHFKLKS